MSILRFPSLPKTSRRRRVQNKDIADAEVTSAFMAEMLPKLEAVTGQIETRLLTVNDDDLRAIYDALDHCEASGNHASIDEHLLMEVVSDEVARRCLLNGILTPWAQSIEDEADCLIAANDEQDGAAR
ncbi:MAG: hypothetical protein ACOH2N_14915 [Devosia sp.]